MKKVAILSLHLSYGGIEKSIVELANILCESYKVEIACIYKLASKEAFEINPKVKVTYFIESDLPKKVEKYKLLFLHFHFIKLWKSLYQDYFKHGKFLTFLKDGWNGMTMYTKRKKVIKTYLKETNQDYIISTRDFLNTLLGKYGHDTIKIAWEHNHPHGNQKYLNKIVKSVQNIDAFVLVSRGILKLYEPLVKPKCIFIPNIIDNIPETPSSLTQKNMISIGRLSKEKGYQDLIDIYSKIGAKYPDWHLHIIGDGPERETLEEKIKASHLENQITLHGFQNKEYINHLLSQSSIYLMTSYTESFGIVLLEAMSYGIPCIAFSSAEGACEIIENNQNGFLVNERNQEEYIQKIKFLMEEKNRKQMIENCQNTASKYTKDKIQKEWFELLKGE